jgi:hypothetical protein
MARHLLTRVALASLSAAWIVDFVTQPFPYQRHERTVNLSTAAHKHAASRPSSGAGCSLALLIVRSYPGKRAISTGRVVLMPAELQSLYN